MSMDEILDLHKVSPTDPRRQELGAAFVEGLESRTHPKPALAKLGYMLYLYEHVGHTEKLERNSYTKDLMAEANLSHEEWAAAVTQGKPASSRPPKALLNKPTPKGDPEWMKAFSKAMNQAKQLEKKLGSKVAEGRLTLTRLEEKAKRLAKDGHSTTIAKAFQTELSEKMTYLTEQHHNYLKKLALLPATTDASSSRAHVAELDSLVSVGSLHLKAFTTFFGPKASFSQ